MNKQTILLTGAAGFIGYHLSKRLCQDGFNVVGIDNMNAYYDIELKKARLNELTPLENFHFEQADLIDSEFIDQIFAETNPQIVVNLAAQAGVRYSLENPKAYIDSNIYGFTNILESCRKHSIEHLIFASSSSVYGANKKMPFSESDNVDHPKSLYAATKKSNELLAHTYSSLYNIPVTGLRFFTVYGPYGRPDMALFLFTKAISEGKPIKVFNNGDLRRDFTYIDDIVDGIVKLIPVIPESNPTWDQQKSDPSQSYAPYRIYNIGNNQPVELLRFIEVIENALGKKAVKEMMPMQPGDVHETYADIDHISSATGFTPKTSIEVGVENFVNWYKEFYQNEKAL